jgi:hypothetical protein
MIAIPHVLTGMAVARVARRPALGWPLALASHFVLDLLPHLDHAGLFTQLGVARWQRAAAMTGAVDALLALLIVIMVVRRQPHKGLLIGGAVSGLLPDAVDVLLGAGRVYEWFPSYFLFHHACQWNVPLAYWPAGVAWQLALSGLALWLLLRCRLRDQSPTTS